MWDDSTQSISFDLSGVLYSLFGTNLSSLVPSIDFHVSKWAYHSEDLKIPGACITTVTSRVTDLVARVSQVTDFSSPGKGQLGSCSLGRFERLDESKPSKFRSIQEVHYIWYITNRRVLALSYTCSGCAWWEQTYYYGLAKVVFHYIVSMVMLSRFQIPLDILGLPTSRATSG